MTPRATPADMRATFTAETTRILDDDPRAAVVLADISVDAFAAAARRHPARVINVGIREQLMVGVAGGLALTGLRPFLHSYATFAVDRVYEQLKLDLGHQDVGAVVVTIGGSYDASAEGRTHQSPGDVALLDTLDGWTVRVPGHVDEVGPMLRRAAAGDDRVYVRLAARSNRTALPEAERVLPLRRGVRGVVLAVGPMLDAVLDATQGLDVTVAYTHTPRPFDTDGLRGLVGDGPADVVLVEPYLAGTSAGAAQRALLDVPHRVLALGVREVDLHRYGSPADHARWQGLDAAGLRASIEGFLHG